MATRPGLIWKTSNGRMPGGGLFVPTQLGNTPVTGDLCNFDAAGRFKYVTTHAGGETAEALKIRAICANGYTEFDYLDKPGYTAGTSGSPGVAQFGGYGARETVADRAISGKRSRFFFVDEHFMWVMTRDDTDAVVPGQQGGCTRSAAGVYILNVDVAVAFVEVVGFYSPHVDGGLTAYPTPDVWVKACNPGGAI